MLLLGSRSLDFLEEARVAAVKNVRIQSRSRSHETYLEGADTVKTPKNGSQEQGVREPEAKPFLKRFRAGAGKIDL